MPLWGLKMATGKFRIKRLSSGGLITNYFCTSTCRHCLYNCSPEWPKDYISKDTARKNFQKIKSLGCHAVHIGGGEPLLRPDKLVSVLDVAAEVGIVVKPVSPKSLAETKTFPGVVTPRPNGEAHVGSLVGGRVVAIPVGLGEKVTKGSPLCKIESPEVGVAQANYIRAHAQDALAQKDLARQQQLKAQDIGAEKSLIEKQAAA